MISISIQVASQWPLRHLDFQVNYDHFNRLLELVADERKARFNRIIISGGIAVQGRAGRTPKRFTSLAEARKKVGKLSLVYGYFDPMKSEIVLFPETILATTDSLRDFDTAFYSMLIEELEHGFQDNQEEKYRSLTMRIFGWTTRFIPLYLLLSVSYVVFTNRSSWWYLVIFLGMMVWMFFPVWFSFFPRPRWYRKLRYKYNRREKDAKGRAVSRKLYKKARRAIWFEEVG